MASTNSALLLPAPGASTNALAEDIRGIKGPVEISSGYAWFLWLLLVVAVAAGAYWYWKKKRRKTVAAKVGVVIPPHRRAKDKLRSALELLSDPYQFCSLVSDVVRVYLEERFELHAPDRTTEEFLDELSRSTALLPEHKALLQDFLIRCDLVKFARHEPTQDELKALLDSALRLIDETAPLAVTPEPAVA